MDTCKLQTWGEIETEFTIWYDAMQREVSDHEPIKTFEKIPRCP